MKLKILVLFFALTFAAVSSIVIPSVVIPPLHAEGSTGAGKDPGSASVVQTQDADAMRIQGELRYRANCGRCHAAPRKFPPRMMATVLRHMRVRATITDQDMRLVLFYMTQ
jgi:hypothetical protein